MARRMKSNKTSVRAKWYIPQGTEGNDVCCDLTATIGIAITGSGSNFIWFVEEDQGAQGMSILAHGTAESIQQAKRLSLAEATWFVSHRTKFRPTTK